MKKLIGGFISAAVITLSFSITALAGQWQWIDGDGDGSAECYYFGEDGLFLTNTVTPDGYTVNSDGVWTQNGVVQSKNFLTTTATSQGIEINCGDYVINLPTSWEGHYSARYVERTGGVVVAFAPVQEYPETLFLISRYKTEQELTEALDFIDSKVKLGVHGDYFYVMGRATDTALEFYSEADRQMVNSLLEDYNSIAEHVVFL